MFIELHQTKDGLPISVNASHIQCFAKLSEECSFIYFDSDHWIEVTEPYDEIKMMLTDRLIAKPTRTDAKLSNNGGLPKGWDDLSEECRKFNANYDPSLYASMVSVLGYHSFDSIDDFVSKYLKKYGEKRPHLIENKNLVREMAQFAWNNCSLTNKNKRRR